ncbi:unnamed protein product [Echinostoma caproni]|uniref:Dynactin subunit 2 n=1 Tax=Echinostoma caproni TaxID=27848 RepID=A0A183BBL6_9TREM|nr:unnamed protein product [Echinostoma caproni]
MLRIIQEQALEPGRLKAKVNALGEQVAKLNALKLNSPDHLEADQAMKVSEQQIIDLARTLQEINFLDGGSGGSPPRKAAKLSSPIQETPALPARWCPTESPTDSTQGSSS